jgi:phosphoserine phosphatase RsbU/P
MMHVGRLHSRPFSDGDVELLTVLADRISPAIEARSYAIERAAAALLERSLLPGRLPRCPGLEFAARYVATEGRAVGGDWYDLFTVPSGALWIVVGDVTGHGLDSAVVMGRIRSALRAYALIEPSPNGVLDLVDRKVAHFEIETLATVTCAVLEPPYDTMTLAVAGHPPPVIVSPGRPACLAEIACSPPIGTNWGCPRASSTIAIPLEAVVAFYTDGLVERRREVVDIGLERLRQEISPGPANRVAQDIMRHVVGDMVPEDDIALVVMRRTRGSTDS